MSVTAVPIRPLKKGAVLRLWLALILLGLLAVGLAWYGTAGLQFRTTESGLQYRVIKEGTGNSPTMTDVTLIDYSGTLPDGTVFDTTKGKQPAPMPVNGSIPGFSEGLQLMKKGGTYRLHIPSKLAYGAEGAGNGAIPPNTDLDFEVTLHEFIPMSQLQGMMGQGGPGGMPGGPGGPPPQ
jgi:hypothetical protein